MPLYKCQSLKFSLVSAARLCFAFLISWLTAITILMISQYDQIVVIWFGNANKQNLMSRNPIFSEWSAQHNFRRNPYHQMPLWVLSAHLHPPLHCCGPVWTPCWGHIKKKPAENEPDKKRSPFCWIRVLHQITEEFHLLKRWAVGACRYEQGKRWGKWGEGNCLCPSWWQQAKPFNCCFLRTCYLASSFSHSCNLPSSPSLEFVNG